MTLGVKGLNNLIKGDIQPGKTILLKGPCGSGKTILAGHFLNNDENGTFMTLEQSKQELIDDLSKVNIFLEHSQVLGGQIGVLEHLKNKSKADFDDICEELIETIKLNKSKKVVIDSVSLLEILAGKEYTRLSIASLIRQLKELNVTTLLINEEEDPHKLEYLVDGVIEMIKKQNDDKISRGIRVTKFRGHKIDGDSRELIISNKGISITDNKLNNVRTIF